MAARFEELGIKSLVIARMDVSKEVMDINTNWHANNIAGHTDQLHVRHKYNYLFVYIPRTRFLLRS
jgi:hypothetical protein